MRRGGALRHPDRSAPRLGSRFAVGTGHLCQIKFWLMQLIRPSTCCELATGLTALTSAHPALTSRDFPSFSLETTRVTLSAVKIDEIGGVLGWGVGGIMPRFCGFVRLLL